MKPDWLINNVHLACLNPDIPAPYGAIHNGLVAVGEGKILWLGKAEDAPAFPEIPIVNGEGGWLTPGFIDCHTHLIYSGDRAQEFEWRLQGESYATIARKGGGIINTVNATRAASDEELYAGAAKRLQILLRQGVTSVEIKSGYGLDCDSELRLLRTARMLEKQFPVTIRSTFLGAHALPPEYVGRSDEYIDKLINEMLPAVAKQGLADAVDVFCENIGFSVVQCRRVFDQAQKLGLPVKGHVEQLSYSGGARLVADFNGLSVDHIEYLPESDIPYLQSRDVAAVLLPGAYYFLQETQKPPVEALREARIPMAVATDLNPGSSPMASLLLAMNQACILFALTPEEALAGVTRQAAKALGLAQCKGQINIGWDADLLLWDIHHPADLSYAINMHSPRRTWVNGKQVSGKWISENSAGDHYV